MQAYEIQIENDLLWREKELVSLKRMAIVNQDNEVVYRTLLRAAWATLYAHFEGFTKFVWELLLDCVQDDETPIGDLSDEFKLIALEKTFKKLRGDFSSAAILDFFEIEMTEVLGVPAIFDETCRLSTDSNLWPNVFERECSKIGITSEVLVDVRSRIKTLVARRNDIAHGKNMTINSVDEYSKYEHAALLVMHDLALQVLTCIDQKLYVRANNSIQPTANTSAD